ncbi:MAG: transglycosylase SLT domain-containing protein [Burkholderiales bacterium]
MLLIALVVAGGKAMAVQAVAPSAVQAAAGTAGSTAGTASPTAIQATPALDADALHAEIVALRTLAVHYENGEGVARDPLHAYALYCQAAKAGDAEAQYDVGWMYLNGRGVARDDALAARFFAMAAAQGLAQAQALLAHAGPPAADLPECMRDPPPPPPPPPEPLDDGSSFVAANAEQARVAKLVRELAPQFDVSPLLALAVIRAESNFDAGARSPKNAQGLMQLVPETSQRFNVKKPYDITQNIRGGLAYLRWLLAYFEGNVPLVAAAYNAGEKTVERYRGVPPYAETRDYVRRVMKVFGKETHPYDASVADPSPESGRFRPAAPR